MKFDPRAKRFWAVPVVAAAHDGFLADFRPIAGSGLVVSQNPHVITMN